MLKKEMDVNRILRKSKQPTTSLYKRWRNSSYRSSGTVSSLNRVLAASTCRAIKPELEDDLRRALCVAYTKERERESKRNMRWVLAVKHHSKASSQVSMTDGK